MKEILIASDHNGYELKEFLKEQLSKEGFHFKDFGCYGKNSTNYPNFAKLLASEISHHPTKQGILICGTGIGMSIAANRKANVRAALCHNEQTAKLSKEHNNANILILGSRVISQQIAVKIFKKWQESNFEGGRHQERLDLIEYI